MARRRNAQPDSLDLLLDTMCNTFGGIVMIAILMAMLIRESKQAPKTDAATAQALAQLSTEAIQEQITAAQEQLRLLKSRMAKLGPAASLIADRNALLDKKKDAEARAAAARQQQALEKDKNAQSALALDQQIALTREKQAAVVNDTRTTDATVAATKQLIARLLNELAGLGGATNTRQIKRPPREEATTKIPFNFVFRYNEAFPVQKLAGGQLAMNTADIDWKGGQGNEAAPRRGAGRKPMAADGRADLLKILQGLDKTKLYVSSYVYRDSFEAFTEFQKILAGIGLEAGWEPVPGEQNLLFGTGGTTLPKQ